MPKEKFKTVYVCTSCGEASPRWMGRCPSCGEWNTMVEDIVKETKGKGVSAPATGNAAIIASRLKDISTTEEHSRIITGISELDRVLGGGIVLGSVVLLGGEPGARQEACRRSRSARRGCLPWQKRWKFPHLLWAMSIRTAQLPGRK